MEKCYEYLGCKKHDCIMYGRTDDTKCWEVEDTLCHHEGEVLFLKADKYKCDFCLYHKAATQKNNYQTRLSS